MVDIPYPDLNPLHKWASVSVKMPVSVIVLDQIESVQVSLAMWAGLDLKGFAFYSVSTLGVGKQTDISDDLADLDKLNCAVNRYLSIWVVNIFAFY
jgi:hypothetical protein